MRYIRCILDLKPLEPAREVFVAALAELGFESFEETETGLNAYIQEPLWQESEFLQVPYLKEGPWQVAYRLETVEPQNWNAVWEQEYEPIRVRDLCMVRAPFHAPPAGIPFDIVISPKMSFGTGHHQTTYLMLDYLLDLHLEGRAVADLGCGTGVLAILAALKGATPVTAIDTDPWAFENCLENTIHNGQGQVEVLQGDVRLLAGRRYHTVLANINKNVLLSEMPAYARLLRPGGQLLLSGFYRQDLPDLQGAAAAEGLQLVESRERDAWSAALFEKGKP